MVSRAYETLVILTSAGTEAELAQAAKQLEEPIKKLGGQVDSSVSWGRRRLAFPIGRHNEGHYHLLTFHVDSIQLDELKRLFGLNDTILRFLILNREDHRAADSGTPPASSPTHTSREAVAVGSTAREARTRVTDDGER